MMALMLKWRMVDCKAEDCLSNSTGGAMVTFWLYVAVVVVILVIVARGGK
jgi:hypothetical protein